MKYIIVLIINLFCLQLSYSQIHEFGVFIGGSSLIGDVSEPQITPNQLALGGLYKWNKTSRYSWRISGIISEFQTTEDKASKTVGEISAGLEFNFFEFDLHHSGITQTPYLYTGLSTIMYKDESLNNKLALGIPITFGYKFRISQSFILGAEIGARYTFTDNLDGSNYIDNTNPDAPIDYSFGNLNNNDWYVFTGITVTYTFGRNPCYCIN
ncbi:DUF6089 family protein [Formosa sp. PL04]|uniref:type IX secretion system protein PorG n=1 Tax=Formosa sp. PL04 TaxID=3081755 RepID=UPI00298166BB|nr:DUF6089 family protein [Formosa sp. PL04]MDW5287357.1 DUF6089 family protein [Formosa sp. PL04]